MHAFDAYLICETPMNPGRVPSSRLREGRIQVECETCGTYGISERAVFRPSITQRARGTFSLVHLSSRIGAIDRITHYVNLKQPRACDFVPICTDRDYPIAYAKDAHEFGLSSVSDKSRHLGRRSALCRVDCAAAGPRVDRGLHCCASTERGW
jgi:hypothetical protein